MEQREINVQGTSAGSNRRKNIIKRFAALDTHSRTLYSLSPSFFSAAFVKNVIEMKYVLFIMFRSRLNKFQ